MTEESKGFTVEQPSNLDSENVYEITVRGAIDLSWLTGFDTVAVLTEFEADGPHPSTRLKTLTDQSGLVGLIRQLHGLGVVLVAIRQASEADDSVQE